MSEKEKLPKLINSFYRQIKTPEDRKKFIELFNYTKNLANDFDITIEDHEYLSMFIIAGGSNFPEKSTINKKLFEIAKNNKVVDKSNHIYDKYVVDNLNKLFFNQGETLDSINRKILNCKGSIVDLHSSIRNETKKIILLNDELNRIKNSDYSSLFYREINKIVTSNKFEQIYYHSSSFSLCAVTTPVTITYDENIYSFGQYIISFNARHKEFIILPYKNNIIYDDRNFSIHPHVFEDKHICWGNASASYAELIADFKIGDLFLIANMILHAYNQDSPVIAIANFKNASKHTPTYNVSIPFHIDYMLEANASIKNDSYVFKELKNKYYNIHNFSIECEVKSQVISNEISDLLEDTNLFVTELNSIDNNRTYVAEIAAISEEIIPEVDIFGESV